MKWKEILEEERKKHNTELQNLQKSIDMLEAEVKVQHDRKHYRVGTLG